MQLNAILMKLAISFLDERTPTLLAPFRPLRNNLEALNP